MKTYRILLISHELSRTGAPNSLLRQARCLLGAGHRVMVWSLAAGPLLDVYGRYGFSVGLVGNDPDDVRRRVSAAAADCDLVVCNTYLTYRYADAFAAQGVPVVWFIRETGNLKTPLASDREFARIFRGFYNIYTVSEYARAFIASVNPHVRFFNNSVEDRFTGYAPIRPGELRFGFIGSVTPRKGLSRLLEAFFDLVPDGLAVTLRIAGRYEGTEEGERLRRLTAARRDVFWEGEVSETGRDAFFDAIDVLCVPSLDEPSGLTLLEGAMYGKALLATDRVGAAYVVNGHNGVVVPVPDLGRGLRHFVDRVAWLQAMQEESRRQYLMQATPAREQADILKMLADNVCNRPPPVAGGHRPVRQFFKKENIGTSHWRFRIWGVPVLTCRKHAGLKRFVRVMLERLGLDPCRFGFTSES